MAVLASDIINEALSILGVYTGDALAAADVASAFFTLSAIIDGYGAQPLTFRQTAVLAFATQAGKQSYTLGTAGGNDWVTPFLPAQIETGDVTMTTGTLELPIAVDTKDQWAAIALKSMTGGILTDVWADLGITSHTLNFWPVPNGAIPVTLYVSQPTAALASSSTAIVMPPGYQECLTFELAIKISSKFGASVPSWVPDAYLDAKANIKAINFPILDAVCDAALLGKGRRTGGGSIDFYIGR